MTKADPISLWFAELRLMSPNRTRGQHWARAKRQRDNIGRQVMWQLRAKPRANGQRRMHVVRYYSGREKEWDPDNLAAACKPLIDALVAEGMLTGDTAKDLAIDTPTQVRAKESGIAVHLYDIEATIEA